MSSKPPLAEIKLRGRSDKPTLEATFAGSVAQKLGMAGDATLVFERGSAWAAEAAAARGQYFVVWVKPAPTAAEPVATGAEMPETEATHTAVPPSESLEEVVRKKLEGRV